MGENSIICESDGCERDSETWIINAAYPGELCKPCHWYCSDCFAKLSADLQAARLTIASLERETLEKAMEAIGRAHLKPLARTIAINAVNDLLPTKPSKNCPHGLDRRAKCALCTVEGL